MSEDSKRPHVGLFGPLMGRHHGFVTTQALQLSTYLRAEGYAVTAASTSANRYVRFADIMTTLVRRGRGLDCAVLEVYGGPSFVIEDAASWLAKRFGLPLAMLLHGGALPQFMALHPRWVGRVLGRADALVAPSAFLARSVSGAGFPCRVIPNVIDLAEYPYRPRTKIEPRLLWMRTFHEVYNPSLALRVLARVRKVRSDATLVMGGQDKGLEAATRGLAQRLGVGDAVRFAGFLGREEKAREGAGADIFLNTNRIDNMPVSVIEACAMGMPVVATDVGGLRDLLVDGQSGLLVPDDDDAAMADAVLRLVEDSALALRLSTQGRSIAERSARESVVPQWSALFAGLVGSPHPAAEMNS